MTNHTTDPQKKEPPAQTAALPPETLQEIHIGGLTAPTPKGGDFVDGLTGPTP